MKIGRAPKKYPGSSSKHQFSRVKFAVSFREGILYEETKAVSIVPPAACCWKGPRDAYSGYVAVREVPGPGKSGKQQLNLQMLQDVSSGKSMKISGLQHLRTNYEHLLTKSKQHLFQFDVTKNFISTFFWRENGKHFHSRRKAALSLWRLESAGSTQGSLEDGDGRIGSFAKGSSRKKTWQVCKSAVFMCMIRSSRSNRNIRVEFGLQLHSMFWYIPVVQPQCLGVCCYGLSPARCVVRCSPYVGNS